LLCLLASGCAASAPASRARSDDPCAEAYPVAAEEAAAAPGKLTAAMRAGAVLAAIRGCDREQVARRYGVPLETLQQWTHLFVGGGRSALLPVAPVTPGQLRDAWRGTWVLRSRIARGSIAGKVDGMMLFGDEESLTLEAGVLSDDFAALPLGPMNGEPFRLGQYSRLMYLQREGSIYVVRMSSSDLLGSYSDYARGMRASLVEPFVQRGEAFVHVPSPVRGYSPTSSDDILLLGDRMLIVWSTVDVVDTWERVSRDPPRLNGEPSLFEAWSRLKRSRALTEKRPARVADLLALTAPPVP